MQEVDTGGHLQLQNSNFSELLAQIREKSRRTRLWPFALAGAICSWLVLFGLIAGIGAATLLVTLPVAVLVSVAVFIAWKVDELNSCVVLLYDLDDELAQAYHELFDAFSLLAACGAVWSVNSVGDVYDPKYHAGASQLVGRKQIHIQQADPPFVRCNVASLAIHVGTRCLHLLPDRILIYSQNKLGAVGYDELSLESANKRFIEERYCPRDAQIVDHTWQYVNKDGGPDRRFKNNRHLPICLYEEMFLRSQSGLAVYLQASRVGLGSQIESAIVALAQAIEAAAENEGTADEAAYEEPATPEPSRQELFRTLLDALCCVMVSDGRASRSEKQRILDVMLEVEPELASRSELKDQIAAFVERVRSFGFRRVIADVLERVPQFKRVGGEQLLIKCVESVASTDGERSPSTQAICDQLRGALD